MRMSPYVAVGSDELDCLAEGDEAVKSLDARIDDLSRNWNPAEIFTPDDIQGMAGESLKLMAAARAAVVASPTPASDSAQMIAERTANLDRYIAEAAKYINTATAAKIQNAMVRAPDIKAFAIRCARAASDGFLLSAVYVCMTMKTAMYMATLTGQLDAFTFAMKKYGGIIGTVLGKILDVPRAAADILDTVLKIGVAGGIAYFGYKLFIENKTLATAKRGARHLRRRR
jgi:hypothetical protein